MPLPFFFPQVAPESNAGSRRSPVDVFPSFPSVQSSEVRPHCESSVFPFLHLKDK